jgi:hypothetical protein
MPDTVRTLAEIQALLADNTSGNISPQDLRDAIATAMSVLPAQSETGWKDLVMPLSLAGVSTANQPALVAFGPSGLREEMQFDVGDYVFVGPMHVNHDIKVGGKAYIHVHWSTGGTNVQPVKWEFQISRALGHNQANFPAPTSVYVTQTPHGTAWRHMVGEVALADALTLTEPDELILVTLRRVTNGATDNTDNVFGLCVDFHYESDRHATLNKAPNVFSA